MLASDEATEATVRIGVGAGDGAVVIGVGFAGTVEVELATGTLVDEGMLESSRSMGSTGRASTASKVDANAVGAAENG